MKKLTPLFLPFALALALAPHPVFAAEHGIDIPMLNGRMRYKVESFLVEPGDTVKLTLKNTDELQHNLVVCTEGAENGKAVAELALKMGTEGMEKGFIPESPLILAHTRLLNPHENQTITFTIPDKEGIYPYVCTFPGHSLLMKGQIFATRTRPGITDLRYDYYEGAWQTLPDFAALTAKKSGKIENDRIDISARDRDNEFGFVFKANLNVPFDGDYEFYLSSDDGSRLIVDGKTVVNNDGVHPAGEAVSGKISLTAGSHQLEVDYIEFGGEESLQVAWSGPGVKNAPLSAGKPLSIAGGGSSEFRLAVEYTPLVVRCNLPETTAHGIAVGLMGGMNYVFDSEDCCVKYGWSGDFLDVGPERGNGTGRGGGTCRPLGTIFMTGANGFPLRIGEEEAKPEFLGYRRDPDAPAFIFKLGSQTIQQKTTASANGKGLTYNFTLKPAPSAPVRFSLNPDGLTLASSAGTWKEGTLTVPSASAASFSVTVSPGS